MLRDNTVGITTDITYGWVTDLDARLSINNITSLTRILSSEERKQLINIVNTHGCMQ